MTGCRALCWFLKTAARCVADAAPRVRALPARRRPATPVLRTAHPVRPVTVEAVRATMGSVHL